MSLHQRPSFQRRDPTVPEQLAKVRLCSLHKYATIPTHCNGHITA
jgi:hypothetical protein